MATTQVNPTRMELTRLKRKLATAIKGHKLLKDKRDELMRRFLEMVRENMELRHKVEAGILAAQPELCSGRCSDEPCRSADGTSGAKTVGCT